MNPEIQEDCENSIKIVYNDKEYLFMGYEDNSPSAEELERVFRELTKFQC